MVKIRESFGQLFNKYRLRSGIDSLSDLDKLLSDEGIIYDESIFSKWKRDIRIPKDRKVVLYLIKIFVEKGGITILGEANDLLQSVNLRDLTDEEGALLSPGLTTGAPFTAPQEITLFIERDDLLKNISWNLLNKRSVLISGMSGNGKTVLAIRVAHFLKQRFSHGILWYRSDIKTLTEILDDIAATFGENVSRIIDIKVKAEIVYRTIKNKELLLVFDNIEDMKKLNEVFFNKSYHTFIVLMTSIQSYTDYPFIEDIHLGSFTKIEADKLAKRILGNPFFIVTHEKLSILYKYLSYSPLGLKIILKQVEQNPEKLEYFLAHLKNDEIYLPQWSYDNKTLEKSLKLGYTNLHNNLRETLSSLSVFSGTDFSKKTTAKALNISSKAAVKQLTELYNLSFIEKSVNGRFRIHPFVRWYAGKNTLDGIILKRLTQYYASLLENYPKIAQKKQASIKNDLENIIIIFQKSCQANDHTSISRLWKQLGLYLWDKGYWMQYKNLSELVVISCLKNSDFKNAMTFSIRDICWILYWQGDIKNAKKYAQQGLEIAMKLDDKFYIAYAQQRLGKIYQGEGNFNFAMEFLNKSLLCFRKLQELERTADTLTYIGETYWLLKDLKQAEIFLREALKIVEIIHDLPQKAIIYSHLGSINFLHRKYDNAEKYYKKSTFIADQLNRKAGGSFWNNLGLGLIKKQLGYDVEARELFLLADQEKIALGIDDNIYSTSVFFMGMKDILNKYYLTPYQPSRDKNDSENLQETDA